MSEPPAFVRYRWHGGEEWAMRLGPAQGPVVVIALPLFEEANRTRAVAAGVMRALAATGIASLLPDLPGQGDSLLPTEAATLPALREAFAAAVGTVRAEGRPVYVAAIRSGALVDTLAAANGRWHLSPQDGPALLRELTRVARHDSSGRERDGEPATIAGNLVLPCLLADLEGGADPAGAPGRIVRLAGDPRPADRHLAGAPPWRRAEPAGDDALAQSLAIDLSDWIRACAAL